MKKIASIFLAISMIFGFLAAPTLVTYAAGQPDNSASANAVCKGVNAAEGGGNCNESIAKKVPKLLESIINILSWIVGLVSVIMIILGGFWVITASGDSAKVGRARSTIIYAIVGLIIVAFAQILVRFVIKTSTSN